MQFLLRSALLSICLLLAPGVQAQDYPPLVLDGARVKPVQEGCDVPAPAPGSRVIVVGGSSKVEAEYGFAPGGGTALLVYRNPHPEPAYILVAPGGSGILRVEGAIDRAVTLGWAAGQFGYEGLTADRAFFLPHTCPLSKLLGDTGPKSRAVRRALLQKRMNLTVAPDFDGMGAPSLPGYVGRTGHGPLDRDPPMPQPVDIDRIVASRPLTRIALPYGEAGIETVVKRGSVEATNPAAFDAWIAGYFAANPSLRDRYKGSAGHGITVERFWRVLNATELPVPDPWWRTSFWLVPAGVPAPRDLAGQQCVFSTDGFRVEGARDCLEDLMNLRAAWAIQRRE